MEFNKKRFDLYCKVLKEYLDKPSEDLKRDLEALKIGFIPVRLNGEYESE